MARVSRSLNCIQKNCPTNYLDNLFATSKLDFSASKPKSRSFLNSSESRRLFNIDVSDGFSAVEHSVLDRLRFDIIFLFGVETGLVDFTLKVDNLKGLWKTHPIINFRILGHARILGHDTISGKLVPIWSMTRKLKCRKNTGWVFQKSVCVTPRKTKILEKFLDEFSRICQ